MTKFSFATHGVIYAGDEIEAKSYLQEAIRESEGQSEHYQFTERVGRLIASLEGRKAWLLLTMA